MAQEIPEHVANQAIAWFARLRADDVDLEDWRRFEQWLDTEALAPAAMREIQELWSRLSVLGEPEPINQRQIREMLSARLQRGDGRQL